MAELNLKVVGKRIRQERQTRNLTIEKLAELINVSPSFLGLVERGERGLSVEKLFKLADLFDTSIDSLIKENTPNPRKVSRYEELNTLLHSFTEKELRFVIDFVRLMQQKLK